jgi:hypothetical protein
VIARANIVPAACAILAIGCLAGLWRAVAVLGVQVPLDPNEGWNAYHALAAMDGGTLYPPAGSFLFNNYPPLSFYFVGTLGSTVGDEIMAGRIVALAAVFGLCAGMFVVLRNMAVDIWNAVFAVLVFLAGLLVFSDYVGMDDPQLLGHAVAIAGLVLFFNRERDVASTAAAAALMALAWFVKHNLVALPLACAIWLGSYDRRRAVWFCAAGLAFGMAGLITFRLAYGVELLSQLASPRPYSLANVTGSVGSWLVWGGASAAVAAVLSYRQRTDRDVMFSALYALIAVLVGVLFSGGAGVDSNVWFDAAIALALTTGLALERWPRAAPVMIAAGVLPLVAGLVLAYDPAWRGRDYWLHPYADDAEVARGDIAFLKAHQGPALCEMLSLCYWAGKPAEVDVFNLGQAYATGARSDDALIRRIAARHYRAVQFDSLDDFALGPRVRQAFERAYRVDHADDNGVFLVPR